MNPVIDIWWAAKCLLTPTAFAKFNKACSDAQEKYGKVFIPAMKNFKKQKALARADYKNGFTTTNGCRKILNAAVTQFLETRQQPLEEYQKECAVTFARLYNSDK